MKNFILMILSVSLVNAFAQLFIRKAMTKYSDYHFEIEQLYSLLLSLITNSYLILGIVCYVLGMIIWMIILSKFEVSLVYPMVSISYIFTALLAYFAFNEPLTLNKIVGILVICLGVYIVTRSKSFL